MVMMVIKKHVDIRRLDHAGLLFSDLDSITVEAETGETFPESLRVCPRAYERSERHIATDAGKTVEISYFHLFTRCAKYPAPKPLSIFITATPAAQEFSIASSADSPPKLAP